jgi:hypothetical protein
VYVSVYFVPEGQITQLLTVMIGQVESERNVFQLFSHELDSAHYDVLFKLKKKKSTYL